MWPFSALMGTSKDMVTAKELKIGKRYKVPSHRGLGPCSTLTRKQHLANGTRYALTFENGKKRRWQFYNFTEKPVFKSCQTRRRRWSSFRPIVSWSSLTRLEYRFVRSHKKQRPLLSPSIKHHIVIMPFGTLALVSNLSFQRSAIRKPFSSTVRILRQIPVPLPNLNIFGRQPAIRLVTSYKTKYAHWICIIVILFWNELFMNFSHLWNWKNQMIWNIMLTAFNERNCAHSFLRTWAIPHNLTHFSIIVYVEIRVFVYLMVFRVFVYFVNFRV